MALALSKRLRGLSMAAEASQSTGLPETGLLLVGMGLGRMEGMTSRHSAARGADHRRYEAYMAWPEDELVRLEKEIGPFSE